MSAEHRAKGRAADELNNKFKSRTLSSLCTAGENACIDGKFAICVAGKFVVSPCGGSGLGCRALPLANVKGTSITCDTIASSKAGTARSLEK